MSGPPLVGRVRDEALPRVLDPRCTSARCQSLGSVGFTYRRAEQTGDSEQGGDHRVGDEGS